MPHTVLDAVKASAAMNKTPAPIHVLAIDDDPSARQMIADYLGDNGILVTVHFPC